MENSNHPYHPGGGIVTDVCLMHEISSGPAAQRQQKFFAKFWPIYGPWLHNCARRLRVRDSEIEDVVASVLTAFCDRVTNPAKKWVYTVSDRPDQPARAGRLRRLLYLMVLQEKMRRFERERRDRTHIPTPPVSPSAEEKAAAKELLKLVEKRYIEYVRTRNAERDIKIFIGSFSSDSGEELAVMHDVSVYVVYKVCERVRRVVKMILQELRDEEQGDSRLARSRT